MRVKRCVGGAAILLSVVMTLIALSGCSGARKVNSIHSFAIYSNNEIVLPIKSDSALEGMMYIGLTGFHSKQNFDKIAEIVRGAELSDVQTFFRHEGARVYRDSLLMRRDNDDKTSDYFCIIARKNEKKNDYEYEFNSLRCEVAYANDNQEKTSFWFLLPVHLLTTHDYRKGIYMDMDYQISATADDVYDFYNNSGWFDLERQEDAILIKGFKSGLEIKTRDCDLPFSFKIAFRRNVDATLFRLLKV